MDVQEAIEAPRFRHVQAAESLIEHGFDDSVYNELRRRGHQLTIVPRWDSDCGGVEAILIDQRTGVLAGAADPRRDGVALGF
jgi:gamma-glutamyltranspeptidase/glutathione hydrolase